MSNDFHKPIEVRKYGSLGPEIVLVHGGPAAAGSLCPVAKTLSKDFNVYEPLQRSSADGPLTVDRHIEDMRATLEVCCDSAKPAIIGHSWGAMLALAFAAKYPDMARHLILIGCGTFDTESRKQFETTLQSRTTDQIKQRLAGLENIPDPGQRTFAMAKIYDQMYACELVDGLSDVEIFFDPIAHQQTWTDMIRLQQQGAYPADFANISIPVKMIHGDHDPHPGRMIYDKLSRYVKDIEYIELVRCGHSPWQEKYAKDKFYTTIRQLVI